MSQMIVNKAATLNSKFADGSISLHPVLARQLFKGTVLYSQSDLPFTIGSIFSIDGIDKANYQIEEVLFDGSQYSYLLTFIGYFAKNPDKKSDFISTVVGKTLTLITDDNIIKQLNVENNWS